MPASRLPPTSKAGPMPEWTLDDEFAGRKEFDRYRFQREETVAWDWADMTPVEKGRWIELARERQQASTGDEPAEA